MSKTPVHNQLFLNDGTGKKLAIQTGIFNTSAVNMEYHRRLSLSVGFGSSTGVAGGQPWAGDAGGGFTGLLVVQTTNELGQTNGFTGTQEAGNTNRPGTNGWTGAGLWNNVPSGTFSITNNTQSLQADFSDIGAGYVRVQFNPNITTAIGSGTIYLYLTAKEH